MWSYVHPVTAQKEKQPILTGERLSLGKMWTAYLSKKYAD